MMNITHIFFDLHDTLIDPKKLHICYSAGLGRFMAERYGGTMEAWRDANRAIVADWDSYYADLDLDGENSLEHMWEGMYRTTRALFRITGTPEPPKSEISTLSREIPYFSTRQCDALYPDVRQALITLSENGYTLGTASHATREHVKGILEGANIQTYFNGSMITSDRAFSFDKGEKYYTFLLFEAGVSPEKCLIIDDKVRYLSAAKQQGMKTAHILRASSAPPEKKAGVDLLLYPDLSSLLSVLSPNEA